jgi:hypothetical protein
MIPRSPAIVLSFLMRTFQERESSHYCLWVVAGNLPNGTLDDGRATERDARLMIDGVAHPDLSFECARERLIACVLLANQRINPNGEEAIG